jgi:hypothetical protein
MEVRDHGGGAGLWSPPVAATGMFPLREQILRFVHCKNYCEVNRYFERLVPHILFVFFVFLLLSFPFFFVGFFFTNCNNYCIVSMYIVCIVFLTGLGCRQRHPRDVFFNFPHKMFFLRTLSVESFSPINAAFLLIKFDNNQDACTVLNSTRMLS